ncbi:hypothetical protein AWV80_06055 [Cupriavidus sp. UYMU48A]|nr:hypothetical protein AWV80_06055 [Cupriavidus sp. UYMU48A]
MTAQRALGTLANYMKDATMLTGASPSLTANDLYERSQNADGDVSQAATYMLQNPFRLVAWRKFFNVTQTPSAGF